MEKSTSYFENGVKHDTYKFCFQYLHDSVIKILVKSEGKAVAAISFIKSSGRMLQPKEDYRHIIKRQKDAVRSTHNTRHKTIRAL